MATCCLGGGGWVGGGGGGGGGSASSTAGGADRSSTGRSSADRSSSGRNGRSSSVKGGRSSSVRSGRSSSSRSGRSSSGRGGRTYAIGGRWSGALSSVSVGGCGGSGLVAFEALAVELQAAQVGPMEQSNTCHTMLKSAYTQNTISKLVTLKQKVRHVFFFHCHLHPSICTHLYVLVNIWCVWNVLQQCPLP